MSSSPFFRRVSQRAVGCVDHWTIRKPHCTFLKLVLEGSLPNCLATLLLLISRQSYDLICYGGRASLTIIVLLPRARPFLKRDGLGGGGLEKRFWWWEGRRSGEREEGEGSERIESAVSG